MRLFYFKNTRRPDFKNVKKFDYNAYWDSRGFTLRTKLMERERIFFNWIRPGSRVLDIGCGNSRLLYELKHKKNCTVLGLDISPKVVGELNRLGVPAKVADLEAGLPADLGRYDYIIASEVLEHLKYPEDLVARLKPLGDRLVVSVPNSAFYRYRLHLMFTGRFFTQWAVHPAEHLRYWSHKDFLEWLGAQGLTLERFKAAAGFELMDLWPNLFCATGCYLARTKIDTQRDAG